MKKEKLQFGNLKQIKMIKEQEPVIQMVKCRDCGEIKPVEYKKEFRDKVVNYPIFDWCEDCF